MGEIGGYQLHLYCDHPNHSYGDSGSRFEEFYGARSLTQARRTAHRQGWRMRRDLPVTDNGTEPAWHCSDCVNLPAPAVTTPEEAP